MELTSKHEAERYYKRYIAPKESEFNEKLNIARRESKKRIVPTVLMSLAAVSTIIFVIYLIGLAFTELGSFSTFFWSSGFIFAGIIGLFGGLFAYAYITMPLDEHKSNMKRELIPVMLKFFDRRSEYKDKAPWSVRKLNWSDLVPSHDDETTEDYIKSEYKGVQFEAMEVKLTREQSNGKNRTTVTMFDGMYLLLKMKTDFRGRIIIKRDSWALNSFIGFYKGTFQGLKKLETSNQAFEDKFEVYSDHPERARIFLNDKLLENLKALVKKHPNDKFAFSITENKILISFENTKDKFEFTIGAHIDLVDSFFNLIVEMELLFQSIDAFEPVNRNRY